MKPPPLPPDEAARRRALLDAGVLDTPPDEAFDDLSRLAATVCGAPMALVTFVDGERHWFKSRVGVEPHEGSRELSFCGHAILGSDVFEVPDAALDDRFADNPAVAGAPHLRFYAGAPILTSDGHALGTVCVFDRVARTLSPEQHEALRALARQAAAQLRLQRQARELSGARDELTRSLAQFEATLEATADGICCLDLRGNVLVCNERFLNMWGFPREAGARGRPDPVGAAGTSLLRDRRAYLRILDEQQRHPAEDRFESIELSDGRTFERYSRPAEARGSVIGRVNSFRDVTERRYLETLKDEFVSTVSHELRTPLTSIRGALGLLEGGYVGELAPEAREFITIARANCERLIRLVNDILDLEKMEAGRLQLAPRDLPARDLAETALSNVRSLADAAHVRLEARITADRVWADEDRLVQVLANLLSNAVRFSPPGGTVELRIGPHGVGTRLEVVDRGPGIAAEQRQLLFRRFVQLDSSDARPKGGSGLGLAITKAIVEQHGGRVELEETPGGGSTFVVQLPAAPVAAVLVAVARPLLLARLEAAIRDAGAEPVVVRTLAEAELALRARRFRAALIELKLPDGDAADWLARFRDGGGAGTPVALLNESGGSWAPPLVINAGDAPGDDLLRGLCEAAGATPRVLVVDDEDSFRRAIATRLRRMGAEVEEAVDGQQALAAARAHPPDLIVLDVGMPRVDGFEVVEALRREGRFQGSLLVYSGRPLEAAERERLSLGATRFLTKGSAAESSLFEAVRQLVVGPRPAGSGPR